MLGRIQHGDGKLEGYRFWSIVLIFGGVAGFARLVYGLMERPMPALRSLLNVYCRWSALAAIGLSNEINRLSYKDGRVTVGQRFVPQDGEA
jgi:NAD/NADP transhydrogenase beta subunit